MKKKVLTAPTTFDTDDDRKLRVVIETPKGSRNKFAFDPKEGLFELKKVLPAGMAFPYDFGFVPSTKADDGDPVDVLVLMDEPAFAGCVLTCRVIGVTEGDEGQGKEKVRNDRIIAIEIGEHSWEDVKTVDDLGKSFAKELEEFFVNYPSFRAKLIVCSVCTALIGRASWLRALDNRRLPEWEKSSCVLSSAGPS